MASRPWLISPAAAFRDNLQRASAKKSRRRNRSIGDPGSRGLRLARGKVAASTKRRCCARSIAASEWLSLSIQARRRRFCAPSRSAGEDPVAIRPVVAMRQASGSSIPGSSRCDLPAQTHGDPYFRPRLQHAGPDRARARSILPGRNRACFVEPAGRGGIGLRQG